MYVSEKNNVIDLWTSKLCVDAEQQLHAVELLKQSIDENAGSLTQVEGWFRSVTAERRQIFRLVKWISVSISLIIMVFLFSNTKTLLNIPSIIASNDARTKAHLVKTKSSEEALLLYGGLPDAGKVAQTKALWESDSENPVFYANYVLNYLGEHKALPDNFLRVAHEIDPENAWFTCLAASVKAKDLCKKGSVHPRSPVTLEDVKQAPLSERELMRRKVVYQYNIVDEDKAAEVMALWRSSLKQEKYDSYQLEMHRLRYPILSRIESYRDQMRSVAYLASQPHNLYHIHLSKLHITLLEKSDLQSDSGKTLLRDTEQYYARWLMKQPDSAVDALIKLRAAREIYQIIKVKSTEGMDDATIDQWRQREKAMDAHFTDLDEKRMKNESLDLVKKHGSVIALIAISPIRKFTMSPPHIGREDLAPALLAENAAFLRVFVALTILMSASILLSCGAVKKGKLLNQLSQEAFLAMPMHVHGMISVFAFLPVLYFVLLYVFTPLGCKDYSMGFVPSLTLLPLMSAVLSMYALPRLMIHRYTSPIEMLSTSQSTWHLRIGWACVVIALVPMHFLPWMIEQKWNRLYNYYNVLFFAPLVFWMLWNALRCLFMGSSYDRVMHGMRRQMMMTASMASVFALALLWVGLVAWENHWIQRDELMKVSVDLPTMWDYEAQVVKTMHQELLEMMGMEGAMPK